MERTPPRKRRALGHPENKKRNNNGANLGFEQKLWQMADKLRSNMDAAEYKHVVLGLIFLKYVSDAFEERHGEIVKWTTDPSNCWYSEDLTHANRRPKITASPPDSPPR